MNRYRYYKSTSANNPNRYVYYRVCVTHSLTFIETYSTVFHKWTESLFIHNLKQLLAIPSVREITTDEIMSAIEYKGSETEEKD